MPGAKDAKGGRVGFIETEEVACRRRGCIDSAPLYRSRSTDPVR